MRRFVATAALAGGLLAGVSSVQAQIPEGPSTVETQSFVGEPWRPAPLVAPDPPQHPHLAPNGRSNLHVDGYQTDVHQGPGPLGHGVTRTSAFHSSVCGSVTFDSRGRIVTVCVGLRDVTLRVMDPVSLETISSRALPPRPPSGNPFQNFTGGGYFYLDARDRAVIPTTDRRILVVRTDAELTVALDADLSAVVGEEDALISALPDWAGRIWFASRQGVVGTLDAATGALKAMRIEPIGNSFAVDSDGAVFIVSDGALYRFRAGPDGMPRVVWRERYPNTGETKPGQTQAGSGTTPTLVGGDRVAITDNADPVHVLVYRRRARVRGKRLTCRVPVFEAGASSTDQSLVATPDLIVAENNHGYTGPAATQSGRSTTPGLARIDLHPSGRGCRVTWVSTETAPTVVPKLSASSGLLYTYTKEPRDDGEDFWYLTAIDVRTGRTVYKALAGEGLGFNNNYAPVTLGPDGTAYVGVLGGLVALRDSAPPPAPVAPRPRARLRVSCKSRATVTGARVLRVVFRSGRRRVIDGRRPFRVRVPQGRRVLARARVEGGTVLRLSGRPARRCRRQSGERVAVEPSG